MPCESWLNRPATGRCVYLSHSLNTVPEGLRWSDKPPRDRASIQQPLWAILLLCVCVCQRSGWGSVCVCVRVSLSLLGLFHVFLGKTKQVLQIALQRKFCNMC